MKIIDTILNEYDSIDAGIVGAQWESWYRALKRANPEAYRKAIGYIEATTLTFKVPTKAAAEYERAAVMLACELLGVRP